MKFEITDSPHGLQITYPMKTFLTIIGMITIYMIASLVFFDLNLFWFYIFAYLAVGFYFGRNPKRILVTDVEFVIEYFYGSKKISFQETEEIEFKIERIGGRLPSISGVFTLKKIENKKIALLRIPDLDYFDIEKFRAGLQERKIYLAGDWKKNSPDL
jgi:hypothetical protein